MNIANDFVMCSKNTETSMVSEPVVTAFCMFPLHFSLTLLPFTSLPVLSYSSLIASDLSHLCPPYLSAAHLFLQSALTQGRQRG